MSRSDRSRFGQIDAHATDRVQELSAPETKAGKLQRAVLSLLSEHAQRGEVPTSNRFLFYELEQRGVLSKVRTGVRRADQDLQDASLALRDRGIVPWGWIVDEERHLDRWEYAADVRTYVADRVDEARVDLWDGAAPPLILTESNATAGVLRATAGVYLCPIAGTKGQTRGFLVTQVAPMLEAGQVVLYIGDHDHAGGQIEANTRRVLEQIIGPLTWERLAITAEQIVAFQVPPIEKSDGRHRPPLKHRAYEAEALGQSLVQELLTRRLNELLPEPLETVRERERQQRGEFRS